MALSRDNKKALLEKMRQNKAKKTGGRRDPTEWRPKFVDGKDLQYKVHILPPLEEGDACIGKDGDKTTCKEDWDLWYFQHGFHYINKQRHECPRIRDNSECPVCSTGFDLMRDLEDKEAKRAIAREWLSQESHVVNIYFTNDKINPEDLRGKVLWWRLPNAIFKQCEAALDREDAGDDDDDPQPYGLFYHFDESFPVKIVLREKSTYNNYDDSKLMHKAYPLADSDEDIEAILAMRIDYPTKIDSPNVKELDKIVASKLGEDATGDSGFDDDGESKPKSESKDDSEAEAKKAAKAEAKAAEAEKMREKAAKKKAAEAKAAEADDDDDDEVKETKSKTAEADDDDDDDDDGELDADVAALLAELD